MTDAEPRALDNASPEQTTWGVGPWQGEWPAGVGEPGNPYDPELLTSGDTRNVLDQYRYWSMEAIVAELDACDTEALIEDVLAAAGRFRAPVFKHFEKLIHPYPDGATAPAPGPGAVRHLRPALARGRGPGPGRRPRPLPWRAACDGRISR